MITLALWLVVAITDPRFYPGTTELPNPKPEDGTSFTLPNEKQPTHLFKDPFITA